MAKRDSQNGLENKKAGAIMLSISSFKIFREREFVQDGEPWMVADKPNVTQAVY